MVLTIVFILTLIDWTCAVSLHHDTFHLRHAQSLKIEQTQARRTERGCFVDGQYRNKPFNGDPTLLPQSLASAPGFDTVTPSRTPTSLAVLYPSSMTSNRPESVDTILNNTSGRDSLSMLSSTVVVEATQETPTTAPTSLSTTVVSESAGADASEPISSAEPSPSIASAGDGRASSGKKGLSYNTAGLLGAFNGNVATWAYNWKDTPDGTMPPGVEFVPMVWGVTSAESQAAHAVGASHVLSFNEPDLATQANLDPQTAAEKHIQYLNPLGDAGVRVVSPAITNGASTDPPMGIPWLTAFLRACNNRCRLDAVAFHWYDSAGSIDYFRAHVQNVTNTAAQAGVETVWLTEFGAMGSDTEIANFIHEATSFLDTTPAVERYAYFMVADGILVNGNSLSTLGQAYAG